MSHSFQQFLPKSKTKLLKLIFIASTHNKLVTNYYFPPTFLIYCGPIQDFDVWTLIVLQCIEEEVIVEFVSILGGTVFSSTLGCRGLISRNTTLGVKEASVFLISTKSCTSSPGSDREGMESDDGCFLFWSPEWKGIGNFDGVWSNCKIEYVRPSFRLLGECII